MAKMLPDPFEDSFVHRNDARNGARMHLYENFM
jgi:hypothetical protein